jgi:quinol monooxygenase YgiN
LWTTRIRSQFRSTPGCVGYTLDAKLLSKTFWTLSAWSDKDAMERFVRSGAHSDMLADMAGRVGNPDFADSTATRADLPPFLGRRPAPA